MSIAQNLGSALSPGTRSTGRYLEEMLATDTPYRRIPRFSPRRYIKNCNPTFQWVNARNAVQLQAEIWGMDWQN